MRKAATGVAAAGKEVETTAAELPKLGASREESRKMAGATRLARTQTLKQREKLEPLLKDAPANAARLAEELPELGADLAKVLRDTKQMKDVAMSLRQAQQELDTAAAHWPQTRSTLGESAKVLRTMHR